MVYKKEKKKINTYCSTRVVTSKYCSRAKDLISTGTRSGTNYYFTRAKLLASYGSRNVR
jgi:hypothetical protein